MGEVAADRDVVRLAAEALRRGELVILPTETVYGLAAAADDPVAVRRVFAAKARPADHPLIVHLAAPGAIDEWARDVPDAARALAAAHWPGPLTLLLRRASRVRDEVTGGRDSVALRVPRHALALDVLRAYGSGVVAPSANPFGRVSPTTAAHAVADLGHAVAVVVDGGPCSEGVESTIVDLTTDTPQLLRAGALPVEEIEATLRGRVDLADGERRAPGMLAAHYAPRCRAERLTRDGLAVDVLDLARDPARYARELYARLRDADARGAEVVVAVMPDPVGLGLAVRDRLHKASVGSGAPARR